MSETKLFYNTAGQEIEIPPLSEFLRDYPDYREHLLQLLQSSDNPVSAPIIQRQCLVRYIVAQAILDALTHSKVAVEARICLDESEAIRLSEYLTDAFSITGGYFHYYNGNEETVVVPAGVTQLNRYSFHENRQLRSIILPEGLLVIDQSAFKGCVRLHQISLPSTLKTIGTGSFRDCKSLREIMVPNSVERIYDGAFWGCSALERAYISTHTWIAESAFPEHTKIIRA